MQAANYPLTGAYVDPNATASTSAYGGYQSQHVQAQPQAPTVIGQQTQQYQQIQQIHIPTAPQIGVVAQPQTNSTDASLALQPQSNHGKG